MKTKLKSTGSFKRFKAIFSKNYLTFKLLNNQADFDYVFGVFSNINRIFDFYLFT